MERRITLDEYIVENQGSIANASGEFSGLLRHIGIAGKIINRVVNKAGLMDIMGQEGNTNASGDTVQKLDLYSNELMIEYLRNSGICAGVASEELDNFISFESSKLRSNKYVVVIDPLDGSSNIDVNISVGTIFGIYRRLSEESQELNLEDFTQKGRHLVAAGYILYGTSTMLVYTTGEEVNGFTYDRGIGEFCLSHRNMKIPSKGKYYSINQAYYNEFSDPIKLFLSKCTSSGMALRYIGSMVADVHRTLCLGGIFIYPGSRSQPKGKLRLLYECNPLSFVIEHAGGKAIDESGNSILDIELEELHQRTSIIIGSAAHVDELMN